MLLELLSIIILGLTLAGYSHRIWWCEILDFFRLQLAVVALLLFLMAFAGGSFIAGIATLAATGINLHRIRHFLPHFSPGGIVHHKSVLAVNAYKQRKNIKALTSVISAADPSVLLVMEMGPPVQKALNSLLEEFPHHLQAPAREGYKVCLLSKNELKDKKISCHDRSGGLLLRAKTVINGKEWQVFSAHPKPGFTRQRLEERALYFNKIAPIIAKSELPVLLMGEFNAVPWGHRFLQFLERANLQNPMRGYGYGITWPVKFPVLGVPLDYILVSRDQPYHDLHFGPYSGSDHFPVCINLGKSQGT